MKLKNIIIAAALVGSAQAAVTLGFSTGTNAAEGFANSSGIQNSNMAWGIIVDSAGDGFDGFASASSSAVDGGTLFTSGATYDPGFFLQGTSGVAPNGGLPNGQLLNVGGLASDDRLFISTNLMALVGGKGRITSLSAFNYAPDMAAGDNYAIVWFDTTSLSNSAATQEGLKYGAWTKPGTGPTNGTILPVDPGSYTTAATGPAGMFGAAGSGIGQSLKTATLVAGVPEPSAALLGAIGALGLLRRRRN